MEIRNALNPYANSLRPQRSPARTDDTAARAGQEAFQTAADSRSRVDENYRRERIGPPPVEGQLLDKRLAFDMLQTARRNGLAGERAYGEAPQGYRERRAITAYESQQQSGQFDEGTELLPRLNTYV